MKRALVIAAILFTTTMMTVLITLSFVQADDEPPLPKQWDEQSRAELHTFIENKDCEMLTVFANMAQRMPQEMETYLEWTVEEAGCE